MHVHCKKKAENRAKMKKKMKINHIPILKELCQRARTMPGGLEKTCHQCISKIASNACFVVVLCAFLALPLSMTFIGMKFLEDCPIQPLIPLYLLVGGIVGTLKGRQNNFPLSVVAEVMGLAPETQIFPDAGHLPRAVHICKSFLPAVEFNVLSCGFGLTRVDAEESLTASYTIEFSQ
ncbi:transmembrane protein 272 isoform X3 [Homo sapiens]|uniref:transmembrane protein 272 isoform X3 n=1 Tax=Homo sapiens TaxID=9606 RepID=UPI0023DE93F1|nr:transmembrane protein 272 isoform X3 [Homo sapiens]